LSPIKITFLPAQVITLAEVGEGWLEVAARAGIEIPTGCLSGSCGACEVDVVSNDQVETCRTCIGTVPPGYTNLTVQLFGDPTW
jgi:ferredoxin